MLTVPFTRGSTMKLRPVISATAFTTASMSALTKLSVTASPAAGDALPAGTPVGATAGRPAGGAAVTGDDVDAGEVTAVPEAPAGAAPWPKAAPAAISSVTTSGPQRLAFRRCRRHDDAGPLA